MKSKFPVVLGVDGGSTKTALVVSDLKGNTLAKLARETSTNLYMFAPPVGHPAYPHNGNGAIDGVGEQLSTAIDLVMSELPNRDLYDYEIVAACIGTAGIDAPGDRKNHHQAFSGCEALKHLPPGKLLTLSDVEIIAGCSNDLIRVCLIAGTGSNCYGALFDADGRDIDYHYIGGLDLLLADDGSAAWIGHFACRIALKALNGLNESQLGVNICEALGVSLDGTDAWRGLKPARESLTKSQLAKLAETVVAPLAEAGDVEAINILSLAANHLARQATVTIGLLRGNDHVPATVLLVGGVWKNQAILKMFEALVGMNCRDVSIKTVNATDGAVASALRLTTA